MVTPGLSEQVRTSALLRDDGDLPAIPFADALRDDVGMFSQGEVDDAAFGRRHGLKRYGAS